MNKFGVLCVGLSLCGMSWFGTATAEAMEGNIQTNMMVTSEYIIGPQDVLEISVWRNPDLSRQVSVRPDGRISLPLIGDVMAVGRNTGALKDEPSPSLETRRPLRPNVVRSGNAVMTSFLEWPERED